MLSKIDWGLDFLSLYFFKAICSTKLSSRGSVLDFFSGGGFVNERGFAILHALGAPNRPRRLRVRLPCLVGVRVDGEQLID